MTAENGDGKPLTPEQQAIADALRPILAGFVDSLNKNAAPMINQQLVQLFIAELQKIGGPLAGHLIGVLQNAATGGWSAPLKVMAVTKYDLEDPAGEEYAEKITTPAQLLQDLHDSNVRTMHMLGEFMDSFEEEDEEDEPTPKPRKKRK